MLPCRVFDSEGETAVSIADLREVLFVVKEVVDQFALSVLVASQWPHNRSVHLVARIGIRKACCGH